MIFIYYNFVYLEKNILNPTDFFKCLADDTRLKILLMILSEQELCVCELMTALEGSQPKISRHLALLKKSNIVSTNKQRQWVYYRLSADLPHWCLTTLEQCALNNSAFSAENLAKLQLMGDRPERIINCCS